MQRQPTPRLDTTNRNRKSHFFRRDDALRLFGDSEKALSDLTDLPSMSTDGKKAAAGKKKKDGRDAIINRERELRSLRKYAVL